MSIKFARLFSWLQYEKHNGGYESGNILWGEGDESTTVIYCILILVVLWRDEVSLNSDPCRGVVWHHATYSSQTVAPHVSYSSPAKFSHLFLPFSRLFILVYCFGTSLVLKKLSTWMFLKLYGRSKYMTIFPDILCCHI